MKYFISGDGTNKTYGIYETVYNVPMRHYFRPPPFLHGVMIKSGIKTMKEAQQELRYLERNKGNDRT